MYDTCITHAGVTKSEMVLWHKQYLECCKELNQWDVVNEYAKVISDEVTQVPMSNGVSVLVCSVSSMHNHDRK